MQKPTKRYYSAEEIAARKHRADKRERAIGELLSTEETYVHLLKLCIKHYMMPLDPNSNHKGSHSATHSSNSSKSSLGLDQMFSRNESKEREEKEEESKDDGKENKEEDGNGNGIGDPTELGDASPMMSFPNAKNILGLSDYKVIFGDVHLIYSLNCQFYMSVKSVIESKKWLNKPQISHPFDTFTPLFSMYSNYMNNYNFKIDCLDRNFAKNKKFLEFSNKAREYCKGQTLSSMIILPIQRLPRYKLLLTEILKNTETDHKDYKKLNEALENLTKITHTLNEKIREYESRVKVNELAQRFGIGSKTNKNSKSSTNNNSKNKKQNGSAWSIIKPHRKFVKEGYLNKIDRTGKSTKYTFLLFNDCLIYATHSNMNDNSNLKFHQELPINSAFSLKNVNNDKLNKYDDKGFEIHSCIKSFIVYADSKIEKESWIEAITNVMAEYHNQRTNDDVKIHVGINGKTLIKLNNLDDVGDEMLMPVPLLIPDNYCDVCMVQGCETKFSKLKRKYHCKRCGYLICGKCTNKIKVNKTTIKPVCRPCQLSNKYIIKHNKQQTKQNKR